jgi:hypothetical protein
MLLCHGCACDGRINRLRCHAVGGDQSEAGLLRGPLLRVLHAATNDVNDNFDDDDDDVEHFVVVMTKEVDDEGGYYRQLLHLCPFHPPDK